MAATGTPESVQLPHDMGMYKEEATIRCHGESASATTRSAASDADGSTEERILENSMLTSTGAYPKFNHERLWRREGGL